MFTDLEHHCRDGVAFYEFEIFNIIGWASDGGDSLHDEENGCGAITEWDWYEEDEESYARVYFTLPIFLTAGCVERAIVSAGGPEISCVGGGFLPDDLETKRSVGAAHKQLNAAKPKPKASLADDSYSSDEGAVVSHSYVPMQWNTVPTITATTSAATSTATNVQVLGNRKITLAEPSAIQLSTTPVYTYTTTPSTHSYEPMTWPTTASTTSSAPSNATDSATSSSTITTPSPVQTGIVSNCDSFYEVVSGDTCYDIAQTNNITLGTFYAWNPAVGTDCGDLELDVRVCIGVDSSTDTTTTAAATPTTSTTSTGTGTTSTTGIVTPMPTQTGMVDNCDTFYDVVSGDGCWAIANDAGVSLDVFYTWNPAVGDDCSGLWPGYYVCIKTA